MIPSTSGSRSHRGEAHNVIVGPDTAAVQRIVVSMCAQIAVGGLCEVRGVDTAGRLPGLAACCADGRFAGPDPGRGRGVHRRGPVRWRPAPRRPVRPVPWAGVFSARGRLGDDAGVSCRVRWGWSV